jgi:transketolase
VSLFAEQDAGYRDAVLPASVTARVAIEAGVGDGWEKYVGSDGAIIAMEGYGESAPAPDLFDKFGFTIKRITATVKELLAAD